MDIHMPCKAYEYMMVFVSMNREKRLLVTDGSIKVQGFMTITHHFGGIYAIYLHSIKNAPKRPTHVTGWTWKH
jgi:hypothetical protein